MAANPAWPDRDTLLVAAATRRRSSPRAAPPRAIKDHYKAEPPRTGAGHAALASAHPRRRRRGGRGQARPHVLARATTSAPRWRPGFLDRFGKLLTEADHNGGFDRILTDDPRWSAERGERAAAGRRMLPLLAGGRTQEGARRGIAVFLRAANGAALIAALPAEDKPDWGLDFQRIQILRRAGRIEEAAKRS